MEKDEKEADEIRLLVGCLSPRPSGSTFLGWQDSIESCESGFHRLAPESGLQASRLT